MAVTANEKILPGPNQTKANLPKSKNRLQLIEANN